MRKDCLVEITGKTDVTFTGRRRDKVLADETKKKLNERRAGQNEKKANGRGRNICRTTTATRTGLIGGGLHDDDLSIRFFFDGRHGRTITGITRV